MKSILGILAGAASLCVLAANVHATTITDPIGDFLGTFVGPHSADLDVISASATYDSNFIYLSTTLAGDIGITANGLYVWGVDRGGATDILNRLPNPVGADVTFNAIVVLMPGSGGLVVLVKPDGTPAAPPVTLALGAVTISDDGDTISAIVPRDLLPSTGADIGDYRFNVWPRIVGIDSNDQVADFAPNAGAGDESTFEASAIPEPASLALMITGIGLFAATTLRRRRTLTA